MHLRRRGFLSILSAAGGVAALGGTARADEVADALAEITKVRSSLQTLVGPFSQERTIGLLATAVKSDGELTLVRPDRLRWELHPPDAVTYWVGPEGFAYLTPTGSGSVGRSAAGRFAAVLNDLMTMLGGDLATLRARYDLSVQREGGGMVLGARPTTEEVKKHVKSLTLRLPPNLWAVSRIDIEEVGGDRSVITFGQMQRDVPVDPARMKPPGK